MEEKRLSLFEQAKLNTESNIEQIKNFKDSTEVTYKHLLTQALFSAKTEIAFGNMESVPESEWSELAQQIFQNPTAINVDELVLISTPFDKEIQVKKENDGGLIGTQTEKTGEGKGIIVEPPEDPKPEEIVETVKRHRQKWKVVYNFDVPLEEGKERPFCRLKTSVSVYEETNKPDVSENEKVYEIQM